MVAPLAPLTAEEIWRGLTGERSVHLTDWPSAQRVPGRPRAGRRDGRRPGGLLGGAVAAQGQGSAGAAAAVEADRGHAGWRRSCGPSPTWSPTRSTSRRSSSPTTWPTYCQQVLTVVPRALGPRVGKQVQQVIKAVKAGDWELVDGAPVAAGVTLAEGEYELRAGRRRRRAVGAAARRRGRGRAGHRRSRRSWPPKGWPATWSGWCSRPAATPTWTSRTGSWCRWPPPARCARRCRRTPGLRRPGGAGRRGRLRRRRAPRLRRRGRRGRAGDGVRA